MKKVEQSTMLSKSTSSVTEGKTHKALTLGQTTKIDQSFALFNAMTENTRIHIWIYNIVLIYFIFQNLILATWPLGLGQYDFKTATGKTAKFFSLVAFWADISNLQSHLFVLFMFFVGIIVLEIALSIIIFYFCYSHSKFPLPLLYILRGMYELMPLVICIPLSVCAGTGLFEIFNMNALVYLPLIGGLIFTVAQTYLYIQIHNMIAYSTYITRGIFNTFCPDAMKHLITFSVSSPLIQFICAMVPKKLQPFFQILLIIASVIIFLIHQDLPFQDNLLNSAYSAIFITNIVSTAIVLIRQFAKFASFSIMVVTFASFIIAMIVFHILYNKKEKKIERRLKNESIDDVSVSDYYNDLGLHKSEKLMHLYIRIGFKHGSRLYMNWSIIKDAVSNFSNSKTINFLAVQMICFFPTENRFMNSIFNSILDFRGLSIHHRFMIFQIYRIKLLRQSSASMGVTEALLEMKQITKDCYSIVTNFWNEVPKDASVLSLITQQLTSAQAKWTNAITEHPNLQSFCEEYAKFCVECSTKFDIAVRQKNKVNLIEAGHNFLVDHCYRSMIRANPFYIKNGLLDTRGNIIRSNKIVTKGNQSTTQSKQSSASTTNSTMIDENDIEPEEEELLASQILTQSKTRLAFQNAISGKRSPTHKPGITLSIISCLLMIAVTTFIFVWMLDYFSPVVNSLTEQMQLNFVNYYQAIGRFLIYYWGGTFMTVGSGKAIEVSPAFRQVGSFDTGLTPVVDFESDQPFQDAADFLYQSRTFATNLESLLVQDAFGNLDIWKTYPVFIKETSVIGYCYINESEANPEVSVLPQTRNSTLKAMLVYQNVIALRNLMKVALEQNSVNIENIYTCALIQSNNALSSSSEEFFDSIVTYQDTFLKKSSKRILILSIIVPIILYLLTSLSLMIIFIRYNKNINLFLKLLGNLPEKAKKEASQSILKDRSAFEQMDDSKGSALGHSGSGKNYILIVFLLYIICPVIILIMLLVSRSVCHQVMNLSFWMYYGGQRLPVLSFALEHITLSVLFNAKPSPNNVTDAHVEIETGLKFIEKISDYQSLLISGNHQMDSINGFDKQLDDLHNKAECDLNDGSSHHPEGMDPTDLEILELHDSYRCSSLSVAINNAEQFVTRMRDEADEADHTLYRQLFFHIFHLSDYHLFNKMFKATVRLEELTNVLHSQMEIKLLVCVIVADVCAVVTMIIMIMVIDNADKDYLVVLTLLRRVSPASILSDHELTDYLFEKKGSTEKERMATYKRVIYDSSNPIICSSKSGTIEIVNGAVTELLGFTPEQLLGQQFDTIFAPEDGEKLLQQMNLMKTGQASPTYEDHVIAISDNDTEIPCRITLIGILEGDKESTEITSFSIGLVDETEAKEQEKTVEKAKAESEKLLYQILPRDIVIKLDQGERDISFTIQSASVIFIDIQKFSDYAATLTPEEIMSNLSLIFDSYDNLLAKYPLMTKIKLIGDDYMAAAGLFSPDAPPQQHAEQILRFGLDCLQELDEINIKLNSNLIVRIGVNTSGPLIGGVLGTDKPVFDIIGDTINVAARLQSTDIPGKIQIPQSTYDLVKDLDFIIEQRGEVMLKGKGKTMSYLVNPTSYFLTSTTNMMTTGNISTP